MVRKQQSQGQSAPQAPNEDLSTKQKEWVRESISHLEKGVTLVKKGETTVTGARIRAGEEFAEYERLQRLAGRTRTTAYGAIIARIQPYVGEQMRFDTVFDMIRAWHAYRLLVVERGQVKTVDMTTSPYYHWAKGYSQLIEENKEGKWVLLEGAEDAALAAFQDCRRGQFDLANISARCGRVMDAELERRIKVREAEREAIRASEEASRREASAKARQEAEAKDALRLAEAAEKEARESAEREKTESAREAARKAQAEKAAREKEEQEATSAAILAAQKAAREADELKRREDTLASLQKRKATSERKLADSEARARGERPERTRTGTGKEATINWKTKKIEEVAEHVCSVVSQSAAPDLVYVRIFDLLASGALAGDKVKAAAYAALTSYRSAPQDRGPRQG